MKKCMYVAERVELANYANSKDGKGCAMSTYLNIINRRRGSDDQLQRAAFMSELKLGGCNNNTNGQFVIDGYSIPSCKDLKKFFQDSGIWKDVCDKKEIFPDAVVHETIEQPQEAKKEIVLSLQDKFLSCLLCTQYVLGALKIRSVREYLKLSWENVNEFLTNLFVLEILDKADGPKGRFTWKMNPCDVEEIFPELKPTSEMLDYFYISNVKENRQKQANELFLAREKWEEKQRKEFEEIQMRQDEAMTKQHLCWYNGKVITFKERGALIRAPKIAAAAKRKREVAAEERKHRLETADEPIYKVVVEMAKSNNDFVIDWKVLEMRLRWTMGFSRVMKETLISKGLIIALEEGELCSKFKVVIP